MKKIEVNNKICIYFDQFVVSNLVSESTNLWREIKDLLAIKHSNDKIYCPLSTEHILETAKKDLPNAIIHDEYFKSFQITIFLKMSHL